METPIEENDCIFTEPINCQIGIKINEIAIHSSESIHITLFEDAVMIESPQPVSLSRLYDRLDIHRTDFSYRKSGRLDRKHCIERVDANNIKDHPPLMQYTNLWYDTILMSNLEMDYERGVEEEEAAAADDDLALDMKLSNEIARHSEEMRLAKTSKKKRICEERHKNRMNSIQKWFSIGLSDVQRRMNDDIEQLTSRPIVFRCRWVILCNLNQSFSLTLSSSHSCQTHFHNHRYYTQTIRNTINGETIFVQSNQDAVY
jgi:hypothetical protein